MDDKGAKETIETQVGSVELPVFKVERDGKTVFDVRCPQVNVEGLEKEQVLDILKQAGDECSEHATKGNVTRNFLH